MFRILIALSSVLMALAGTASAGPVDLVSALRYVSASTSVVDVESDLQDSDGGFVQVSEFDPFDVGVGGAVSFADGNGNVAAGQTSTFDVTTSGLQVRATGSVGMGGSSPGFPIETEVQGSSYLMATFFVTTTCQYDLSGTIAEFDRGVTSVQLDGPGSFNFSESGSTSIEESGFLSPGGYNLTIEVQGGDFFMGGSYFASGEYDLTLTIADPAVPVNEASFGCLKTSFQE